MSDSTRSIELEGVKYRRRLEHAEGTSGTAAPSVATIRQRTSLSQPKFARLLGVSVRTLQEWEQGRRAPSGAARTLLRLVATNPRVLTDAQ
jgi:putative transcriptional regulator